MAIRLTGGFVREKSNRAERGSRGFSFTSKWSMRFFTFWAERAMARWVVSVDRWAERIIPQVGFPGTHTSRGAGHRGGPRCLSSKIRSSLRFSSVYRSYSCCCRAALLLFLLLVAAEISFIDGENPFLQLENVPA